MSYNDVKNTIKNMDVDEALALLERAVQEKGDEHVDGRAEISATCLYFDPKTREPLCIIGHILAYKGHKIEDFEETDVDGDGIEFTEIQQEVGVRGLFDYSDNGPVVELLSTAQAAQDTGSTWGEALKLARQAIDNKLEVL